MNGQKKSSDTKQNIVDDFIKRVPPYDEMVPLEFDIRGYSQYVKENDLSEEDITSDILKQFEKKS